MSEHESLMDDGYDTTIVLDCGCEMRLNLGDDPRFKVGDFFGCQQHSEPFGFDPKYGTPLVERDRRVTEVLRDKR